MGVKAFFPQPFATANITLMLILALTARRSHRYDGISDWGVR